MSENKAFGKVAKPPNSPVRVTATETREATKLETEKVLEMERQRSPECSSSSPIPREPSSNMDIISPEKSTMKWECVAGLEDAKTCLREQIVLPFKFPHLFTNMRRTSVRPLLYGPPGTGKSYLIQAVASEAKCNLWTVRLSDLISLENPMLILKNIIQAGCDSKPSIICLEELESISPPRGNDSDPEDVQKKKRGFKTELLMQMDSILNFDSGVQIVGVTNAPWKLDRPLQRRFGKRLYFPLPGHADRQKIFQIHVEGSTSHDRIANFSAEAYRTLADKTEGFSAADISCIVRHARDGVDMSTSDVEGCESTFPTLDLAGVLKSLESIHPTVIQADIEKYDQWTKEWSG